VELKYKLEKDWQHEIAEAKKAVLMAAKKDGRNLPMEQIDLDALTKPNQPKLKKSKERDVSGEKDVPIKTILPGPGQYKLKSEFDEPKLKHLRHQFFDSTAPRFISVGIPNSNGSVVNPDVGPGSYINSDKLAEEE
jgi:hypothetical protein